MDQIVEILNKETSYYLVVLDESTDPTHSAQVLYFVRIITEEFVVRKELLTLGILEGRTRSKRS